MGRPVPEHHSRKFRVGRRHPLGMGIADLPGEGSVPRPLDVGDGENLRLYGRCPGEGARRRRRGGPGIVPAAERRGVVRLDTREVPRPDRAEGVGLVAALCPPQDPDGPVRNGGPRRQRAGAGHSAEVGAVVPPLEPAVLPGAVQPVPAGRRPGRSGARRLHSPSG